MFKVSVAVVMGILLFAGIYSYPTTVDPIPTNSSPNSASYIDLIKWGGITYVKSFEKKISKNEVGDKIGEIKFKVVGSGKSPDYQIKDGDATFLEEGTAFYKIKNSQDIAVYLGDKWVVYEKTNY
ncbi:hypothetical protein [Brevibacillus sp. SAFN-007a]|uniref:hypothetical protein n=1 Tax=Brevibacillus TaxID=55080 RepID=UPI003F7E5A57